MKYFIQTFGCQQNEADSERLAAYYNARGYSPATSFETADIAVINTCIVRRKAEQRVYGLVHNLKKIKQKNPKYKIIITGCLVGAANREPSGKRLKDLHKRLPSVDEFLPIEEVGFEYKAIRKNDSHALIPISNGCNNYCTFCIVPFSRGKEISRPFQDIISEAQAVVDEGCNEITLLGQNVNSYGADLVKSQEYTLPNGQEINPVMVTHLGRKRIPTLFPYLLDQIAQIDGIKTVHFVSSNPWDFSDELIQVMKKNKNISRELHLPVQAGDNEVLRRMNRWYTREAYMELVEKIRKEIPEIIITTDIIVGFPGETTQQFEQTIDLAKKVNFSKAYIAYYSPRTGTAAAKIFQDDVAHEEKKRRWLELDKVVNYKMRPEFKQQQSISN